MINILLLVIILIILIFLVISRQHQETFYTPDIGSISNYENPAGGGPYNPGGGPDGPYTPGGGPNDPAGGGSNSPYASGERSGIAYNIPVAQCLEGVNSSLSGSPQAVVNLNKAMCHIGMRNDNVIYPDNTPIFNSSPILNRLNNIEQRTETLNSSIGDIENNISSISDLETRLNILNGRLNSINRAVTSSNNTLNDIDAETETLSEIIDTTIPKINSILTPIENSRFGNVSNVLGHMNLIQCATGRISNQSPTYNIPGHPEACRQFN